MSKSLTALVATITLSWTVSLITPVNAQTLSYPTTKKVEQTDTYFGTAVADPYRWLEDDNADDTKAWVTEQNKVTFGYLESIPFRQRVKARLTEIINYPKYGAPFVKKDYVFFYKNDGLQNQSVLYYQKGMDGTPEVLLDPNTFSTDGTAKLAWFRLSHDAKYAAYAISQGGSDWVEIFVMEVATKKVLEDHLKWVKFSGATWRGDGFYYSRYPQPAPGTELTASNNDQKIYFHKVGTPQSADQLVYEDTAHPQRSISIGNTDDEQWEFLYVRQPGLRGNAIFYRRAGVLIAPFSPIVGEIGEDQFGVVDETEGKFLVQTNQHAPNGKIVLFDPQTPDITKATVVIAEQAEPMEGIATAGGKLFVTYLKDVISRVYQYDYHGKKEHEVALPDPGTVGGFDGERGDSFVFYTFTSYNYPPTIFRYDIPTGKSTLFRTSEIKNFHPDDYVVEQKFVTSKDGTKIPLFITYKKGLKKDGKNPTLLYGYGGFQISLTPSFSALRIGWLEQGGIFALANLRGGTEYGEKWHEAAMKEKKQNVFDDCIASAEYLVKEGYTSPAHLGIQGGSNGGLLVGAVINQRPDLFGAAIPQVGVMDMLRYQKFTAGKFWTVEYGSSEDSQASFENLFKYSPMHSIKQGAKYPAVLVTTADHDDRVVPAHSFKYAATLQEKAAHATPLLIRIDTKSGHGSSNLTKQIEEVADIYSFLFANLGVTPKY